MAGNKYALKPPKLVREAFLDAKNQKWESRRDGFLTKKGRQWVLLRKHRATEAQCGALTDWWLFCGRRGLRCLPGLMRDKQGRSWVEADNGLWMGVAWTGENTQPYANRLTEAARALAALHQAACGVPKTEEEKPVIMRWIQLMQERLSELLSCRRHLEDRGWRTGFEALFLEAFDEEYRWGQEAVNQMVVIAGSVMNSPEKSWMVGSFLPEDLVKTKSRILFLDIRAAQGFDMLDLSLLIAVAILYEQGDTKLTAAILERYESLRPLKPEEFLLCSRLMLFPKGFWYLAKRYFLDAREPDKEAFWHTWLRQYIWSVSRFRAGVLRMMDGREPYADDH
jgi:hypothetical protein